MEEESLEPIRGMISLMLSHKFGYYALKCCYDIDCVEESWLCWQRRKWRANLLSLNHGKKDDKNSWYLDDGEIKQMCSLKEKIVKFDENMLLPLI